LTLGFTGPSVVRLDATGNVPAAVRALVALNAVVDGPEGIDVSGCDRSNRSGLGGFVAVGLRAAA
jgi:hypothetical protein